MSSSPAYANFNAKPTHRRPPIREAIRGLLGIAQEGVGGAEINGGHDGSNEVIVVDAEVDGSRYRLIRMPSVSGSRTSTTLVDSRSQSEIVRVASTERRLHVGEFRRVLIAEHDRTTRLGLQQLLQEWGFEVVPATNGAEALNILEQRQPPELAILSRRLPGIDGVELCRRIGERASDCSPYLFILARRNERQDIVHALESGAAEYLTLPFEPNELRARLIAASRILKRQQSLISSRDRFRAQATSDALTGVWNRRAILEILENRLLRGERHARSTGVLLVDLDHFKRVNDLYGHLVGDLVLRETGRRLRQALRSYDSIGRYGGEEFLIVAPGSNENELCELAERLRATIEREPYHVGRRDIRITLSVGATNAQASEKSTFNVIAAADASLYKAKKIGRNRTVYGVQRSNEVIVSSQSESAATT